MLTDFLLPVLAFGTLLSVIVFALISQKKVLDRMDDPNAIKSTLAADKDSHGKPADV
ncbi:hypothetical protein JANAI62_01600 [Jannaschia pagri]|uniref:Uncharacterized protein n=1 Tax=Jannaschia pagri TaxID=2829797 RepID=A0ABQ4NHI2_9RHOB|nr:MULTISPECIES: hypothetical protein [unclassified Jannaschia]GIT90357.1 hypothetical protein JANAI61_08150 [Jannaschia sp. AI_61]GIT93537.1 hypothetical protein JANAI62_01600 [Jannaschia sp. AI_62]